MPERGPLPARMIIFLIALLLTCSAIWAAYAEVDEITRGEGKVIPANKTQIVQATEPGVVEEIFVKVGQSVKKGSLLVRLDDTTTTSELGESIARIRALTAEIARLEIEAAGDFRSQYDCPEEVRAASPSICDNEASLLEARRDSFSNRLALLKQRQLQREKELDEVEANIGRLEGNLAISQRELKLLQPLRRRRLVAQTELIRVQKEVNETEGQLKTTRESVDKIKSSIEEARLQVEELNLQIQQEAFDEKTEALAQLSVLRETVRGGESRVERTDIRSPVNGIINSMEVNTLGAFVQLGSTIAEVVPSSDELLIEARVSPSDIGFIRPDQVALVKITAFDFSIYGGLDGKVVTVTPDSILDQATGEAYFEVLVKTDRAYLTKGERKFTIAPGMISSVDIITGRKSILHYLLKPINKARHEALTER